MGSPDKKVKTTRRSSLGNKTPQLVMMESDTDSRIGLSRKMGWGWDVDVGDKRENPPEFPRTLKRPLTT